MKNLWEVWPKAITNDYCDYIIKKALTHQPQDATVGFEHDNRSDKTMRRSVIRWLDVFGRDSDIAETLMRYCRASNRNNFGFDIGAMNEIQFTEYFGNSEEGGKYDWHYDTYWENPSPYDRKLSIVIQLSHPDEYSGGEFEFFGMPSPGDSWKERGSALIFPSFFHHRVLPVMSGKRISLVSWIEGPKWR